MRVLCHVFARVKGVVSPDLRISCKDNKSVGACAH